MYVCVYIPLVTSIIEPPLYPFVDLLPALFLVTCFVFSLSLRIHCFHYSYFTAMDGRPLTTGTRLEWSCGMGVTVAEILPLSSLKKKNDESIKEEAGPFF